MVSSFKPIKCPEMTSDIDFSDNFVLEEDQDDEETVSDFHDSQTGGIAPSQRALEEKSPREPPEDKAMHQESPLSSSFFPSSTTNPPKIRTKKQHLQDKSSNTQNFSHPCFSSHRDWTRLYLSRPLLKACAQLGFTRPTLIQEKVIPVALQGCDILATAQTGSGKTGAFLLPILERLCQSQAVLQRRVTSQGVVGGAYATKALVLLPTRELAAQCYEMLDLFSTFTAVTKLLVTGGLCQKTQESCFRRQPDIIIATPGRVLDILLNASSIHLELVEIIVLDEADRLLEMGFQQECLEILSHCSKGRQTLLFSATLSEVINDLASLCLKNPVSILISESHSLPSTLSQVMIPIPKQYQKLPEDIVREALLLHLSFHVYTEGKIIVFFSTKKAVHRTALLFRLLNVDHAELHGNLTQAKRLEELEKFQSDDSIRFLLSSGLAARGLDISGISFVINVSVPPCGSRYVHQVGRVARLGKRGTAVTFYSPKEKLLLKRIVRQSCKDDSITPLKLLVEGDALTPWLDKIKHLEKQRKQIIRQEICEKELRLAEMEAQKGINMQLYENEILARPKKRWLLKSQTISTKKSKEDPQTSPDVSQQRPVEDVKPSKMETKTKKNRHQTTNTLKDPLENPRMKMWDKTSSVSDRQKNKTKDQATLSFTKGSSHKTATRNFCSSLEDHEGQRQDNLSTKQNSQHKKIKKKPSRKEDLQSKVIGCQVKRNGRLKGSRKKTFH